MKEDRPADPNSNRTHLRHPMRFLTLFLFSFSLLQAQIPGEPEKAKAALKILDSWHATEPEKAERTLHFVLWTPKGRAAPEKYEERLTRIMTHIRDFYGREMNRLGFGPRSINLPMDGKKLKVHLIEGQKPKADYGMSSGNEIRKECLPALKKKGINADKETVVIFCNLAQWDGKKLIFTHKSPYYAGGTFQRGTAWQLDSPELDTLNLPLKEPLMRDGQYGRISLGKHNSIFIGGIAHELGHALGLPHCRQRPDEAILGTALMGSGNRTYGDELRNEGKGSFLTLAHALRLASHPQFSGSMKGFNIPVSAKLTNLKLTTEGKAIKVSGRMKASPPIYGVVAYFDPEGGSDYNATTATAVPDAEGNFSLSCDALAPGKAGELRLIPLHVNGSTGGWLSQTKFKYSYQVGHDGIPDLGTFETLATLAPFIKALQVNDREMAMSASRQLDDLLLREITSNVLAGGRKATAPPASADTKVTKSPLTAFKASQARVGWRRPAFDFLPEPPFILEAGGQLFKTGIYAHAPARHQYDLGGKWKRLSGSAGLPSSKAGSVVFEIKGDGKTLWKSKTIKGGKAVNFSVKVDGVNSLELIVGPTNDGASSDWGLWLEPTITR